MSVCAWVCVGKRRESLCMCVCFIYALWTSKKRKEDGCVTGLGLDDAALEKISVAKVGSHIKTLREMNFTFLGMLLYSFILSFLLRMGVLLFVYESVVYMILLCI